MGNLGWYQLMTTVAKKVGGPKRLFALVLGGGAILGGGAVAGRSHPGRQHPFYRGPVKGAPR